MRTLIQTLRDYDRPMIDIIANRWDVDIDASDFKTAIQQLSDAMLNPANATHEWSRLSDEERQALQLLLGSAQHKMPMVMFQRMANAGEIRPMGEEKRKREKPHLAPVGIAEHLYYRGLISQVFDQGKVGAQAFVYVPEDLAAVLPVHQTGFDPNEPDPFDEGQAPAQAEATTLPTEAMLEELALASEPPDILKADTAIVDDMTTMLAYIQINAIHLKDGFFAPHHEAILMENFVGPRHRTRLFMMLRLAIDLKLLEEDDDLVTPERKAARLWLEASRAKQVNLLVAAWQATYLFNELWQVPSLQPEASGWQNDPTLVRDTLYNVCEVLPPKSWVSIGELIEEIKGTEPDFQRPGADYDSWYIRDAQSGEYLNGFESWDAVEGATLYFTIVRPMLWLGLVDLGKENPQATPEQAFAFRLTAFGRAWAGMETWPNAAEPDAKISIDAKGTIFAPRAVSRYDRFQLARFAEWRQAGDPYSYQLTSASLRKADEQGIKPEHIEAFLKRATEAELSAQVQSILNQKQKTARTPVVLQRTVIVQLETDEQMTYLWENPNYRRFLGKRLGPLAVQVREDQVQGLIDALEEQGIPVEKRGLW